MPVERHGRKSPVICGARRRLNFGARRQLNVGATRQICFGASAKEVEGFCCPVPSGPRLTLLGVRASI
jgi:hypothetical protein